MAPPLPAKEATLFKAIVKHYELKSYKKGLRAADQVTAPAPSLPRQPLLPPSWPPPPPLAFSATTVAAAATVASSLTAQPRRLLAVCAHALRAAALLLRRCSKSSRSTARRSR